MGFFFFLLLLLLSFKNLFELFLFSSQSHRFVPFFPLVALVKRVTELITLLFLFKCCLNEIEG